MAGLPGEEAVRADLGEFLLDGRLVDAAGDASLELAEGPDREERAGLLPDLNDVKKRDLVI
jgi:hypothetical protein